jgi:hypothetical protein
MTQKSDCKFCNDGKDLLILPLRYAALGSDDSKALSSLPKLSGTLGKGINEIALSGNARYTVRPLRSGYLYVLLERAGVKSWQAYSVTEGGQLYRFEAENPPAIRPKFSCNPSTCGVNASMIKIEGAAKIQKAYLLFRPDPITPAMLADYKKNADSYVGQLRMQAFSPAAWIGKQVNQSHSLQAAQLNTFVAEMLAEKNQGLAQALNISLFPPYSDGGTQANAPIAGHIAHLKRLQSKLLEKSHPAFVLHDAIGITQELNDFRNEALEQLRPWLAQVDKASGSSNERKLHVLSALDDIQETMRRGAVQREHDFRAHKQQYVQQHSDHMMQRQLALAAQYRKMGKEEEARQIERDVELRRQARARNHDPEKIRADAERQANERWQSKYADDLNTKALNDFRSELETREKRHEEMLLKRVDNHLAWIRSQALIEALHVYDRKHAPTGQNFQNQIGLALAGFNYTEAGKAQIIKWAKDTQIKLDNLLLRATTLNQLELEEHTKAALAKAQAAPELGEPAWWTFIDYLQANSKNLIDSFDKTYALIGEEDNLKWLNNSPLGQGLVANLLVGQAMFSFGASAAEKKAATVIFSFCLSSLGKLSANVLKVHLAKARPGVTLDTAQAAANINARAQQEIVNVIEKGGAAGYHKVRLAGLITLIEAFGLYVKASKKEKGDRQTLEITAAALATTAAGFEILAIGMEFVKDRYKTSVGTGRGAAAAFGGIKLFAGTLATVGGGIAVVLDVQDVSKNIKKGKRKLAALYILRTGANLTLTLVGSTLAFSSTGPLFTYLGQKYAAKRALQAGFMNLARGAAFFAEPVIVGGTVVKAARTVYLLRALTCTTWVTLALTLAIFIFTDDALEDWCQKSTFRKDPKDESFKTDAEELASLYQAFAEVR